MTSVLRTAVLKTALGGAAGALALMLALTTPPRAQQTVPQGMAACRADVATFCKGIEAGKGKRLACLLANQPKLQPACNDVVTARAAKQPGKAVPAQTQAQTQPPTAPASGPSDRPIVGAVPAGPAAQRPMAACRDDMKSLCGNVQAGGGNRIRCLRENQAKVSAPCAEALATKAQAKQVKRAETRGACKDDARQFCADQKGPLRRQCLLTNRDKLSAGCAAVLKG